MDNDVDQNNEEIWALKRQVADLSEVLLAVLRDRHDTLRHADDFPGSHPTAFMNECRDPLCQHAHTASPEPLYR